MIQFNYTFDPETRTLTPSGDPVNVKGDTNVVQIVFTMPASYEGLALSSYVWRVFYKIAMNTKLEEVRFHQFTDQTTEGENLVLTWTVTNSVTEFAGHLGFALSGTLTDTGGNVTNRINSIPAYERIEPTIGGGSYTEDDAEIEGIKDFLVGIQEAAETAAAEAEASAARAEQIADELEPYKSLAIVESASGNPATFTDGSNGVPMKSVSLDIDPVQDLHGYEYPWVGGAGKNLLDAKKVTKSGVTFTADADGYVTASPSNSDTRGFTFASAQWTFQLKAGTYNIDWDIKTVPTISGRAIAVISSSGTMLSYNPNYSASGTGQFTLSEDTDVGVVAKIFDGAIRFQIRKSTDTQAWTPYSNICPISGWDEVKVTRTGKNILYNPITQTISSNGVTFTQRDDNKIVINGTASSNSYYNMYSWVNIDDTPYGALRGKSLKLVNLCGISGIRFSLYTRDANNNEQSAIAENTTTITTISEEATMIYIAVRIAQGTTLTNFVLEPMIVFSDVADTDYEPYKGEIFPISLTSAGTVYGGILDATTGELVVDRKMVDLGSLTWSSISASRLKSMAVSSQIVKPANNVKTTAISDRYESFANSVLASNETYIGMSVATDGGIVVRTVSGNPEGIIVYPLATPLTYTLTPSQITSLLGTNHVWADCGEVAVEYVADTKMYIDKIVASL